MWTVPNPLLSTAIARPDHVVLVDEGADAAYASWSASALAVAASRRATALRELGVAPGDRIALIAPSAAAWIVDWHAIGWLGAAVVPLPTTVPLPELRTCLRTLRPSAVICTADYLALATEEGLPALVQQPARAPEVARGEVDAIATNERAWPLDEVRAVVLTSGTSGEPRPVELVTGQFVFSAFGSAIRLGHDAGDRWLACLPLHHVGGISILLRCALMGTCVVLQRRFDAATVARALDSGSISLVSLVPTMLERVLEIRPSMPFPEALRVILLGGEAASDPLVERCRELGAPVSLTWGMSEAGSQVATRFPGDLSSRSGCGPPMPFARVDADSDGLLSVHGPIVGIGSYLETHDLGRIDSNGRVHVTGRADDIMISGGEKIAPSEIEGVLRRHAYVRDVAVGARHDGRWGERPVAVVELRHGLVASDPVEADLRGWCRDHLAAFKTPDAFIFVDTLPRTAIGKLARSELRRLVASHSGGRMVGSFSDEAPVPTEAVDRIAATARRRDAGQVAARILEVRQWLAEDLGELETAIRELGSDSTDIASRAAGHLLATPGKWIRPMCVLLAGRLASDAPSSELSSTLRRLALAAELVHNATLLHDDVIDEGSARRGEPTARVVFGNTASILAGDHLLVTALDLVRSCGHETAPVLLDELLAVIREMIAGEALQLEQQGRFELRPDVYLRIAHGKTASLFRWALRAGARVSGMRPPAIDGLGKAGTRLGIAFQLVDDVLDLEGNTATIGKEPLADVREGKLTWPLLVAAQRSPSLVDRLREVAAGEHDGDEESVLAATIADVRETGALGATRAEALRHLGAALEHIVTLPRSPARGALEAVIDVIGSRIH